MISRNGFSEGIVIDPKHTNSAWAPLTDSLFRWLWVAALVSNTGMWMNEVAAAWLMTSLTDSALLVSLVHAAAMFPVFVLALPSGALADIIDRRKYLLWVNAYTLIVACCLAGATALGMVTPLRLLGCVFLLGIGLALRAPAWQASIPELVRDRRMLPAATALNSAGINISRAVGAVLAGVILARLGGAATVFAIYAVSLVGMIGSLLWWRRPQNKTSLPSEGLTRGVLAGIRFVRSDPPMHRVLWHTVGFFVFASSVWALLPLVAREQLGVDSQGYGLLLAIVSAGGILGVATLPFLSERLGSQHRVMFGSLLCAACLLVLPFAQQPIVAAIVLAPTGSAWIIVFSALSVSAQQSLASWVRARGMSIYLAVVFGSVALGSAVWGTIASRWGVTAALTTAGAGMICGLALSRRVQLPLGGELDFAPSLHWPAPQTVIEPCLKQGPVMVMVEYPVILGRYREFGDAMQELRRSRRRDGAYFWELFQDVADPDRFVECFLVDSWLEHLRQHERVTFSDQEIQDRIRGFLVSDALPTVRHFIASPMYSVGKPLNAGQAG